MSLILLNPKFIVFATGGAFIGYALTDNTNGAILGGIIGFILSLRY